MFQFIDLSFRHQERWVGLANRWDSTLLGVRITTFSIALRRRNDLCFIYLTARPPQDGPDGLRGQGAGGTIFHCPQLLAQARLTEPVRLCTYTYIHIFVHHLPLPHLIPNPPPPHPHPPPATSPPLYLSTPSRLPRLPRILDRQIHTDSPGGQPHPLLLIHACAGVIPLEQRPVDALRFQVLYELLEFLPAGERFCF